MTTVMFDSDMLVDAGTFEPAPAGNHATDEPSRRTCHDLEEALAVYAST